MPGITNLGHLGLFCEDLEKMRDFYSRFMGLTSADEDLDRGQWRIARDVYLAVHRRTKGRRVLAVLPAGPLLRPGGWKIPQPGSILRPCGCTPVAKPLRLRGKQPHQSHRPRRKEGGRPGRR